MLRHEAPAADAKFRVAFCCEHTFNELHTRPDAAGILPTATGTAEPLAQEGARQNKAALMFEQLAGERSGLPGGSHAN